MGLRRYIVWVPYGYHIKKHDKNTEIDQPATKTVLTKQTKFSPTGPHHETSHQQNEKHKRSPSNSDDVQQNETSQVARFEPDFNPYQHYLNDMAHSLTAMPSESFVYDPMAQSSDPITIGMKRSVILPPKHDVHEPPLPDRENKRLLKPTPKHDATLALNTNDRKLSAKTIQLARERNTQSQEISPLHHLVNKQPPAGGHDSHHSIHNDQPSQQSSPNLRRLTGVRTCLQASHHE